MASRSPISGLDSHLLSERPLIQFLLWLPLIWGLWSRVRSDPGLLFHLIYIIWLPEPWALVYSIFTSPWTFYFFSPLNLNLECILPLLYNPTHELLLTFPDKYQMPFMEGVVFRCPSVGPCLFFCNSHHSLDHEPLHDKGHICPPFCTPAPGTVCSMW